MVLDYNSTSSRWADFHDVAGIFMGSLYASTTLGYIDDVEFHVVPEPSGLLALGSGLICFARLIRRRR